MATRIFNEGNLGGGAAADAGAADVGGGIVAEVVGAAADNVNPTGFDEIFTLDNGRYAVDVSPTGETQIADQATGQTFNGDDFYQVEQEAGIELTGVDALEQTTEADTLRADEANQALDQERAAASNDTGGNGGNYGGGEHGGNGGYDPTAILQQADQAMGNGAHAAGATAEINGTAITATSGPGTTSQAGIGDGSTCAECHLAQQITSQSPQGPNGEPALQSQTINVGVSQLRGVGPCASCQLMFPQLATYTGANIDVWWIDRDGVRLGPIIGIGGPQSYYP